MKFKIFEQVNKIPGTYVLILKMRVNKNIRIGKLGRFVFSSGYYFYVGSAFGPGGLAGRIHRHITQITRPHWHIDYFRKTAVLKYVVLHESQIPREHDLAQLLGKHPGMSVPVRRFGASDCRCKSHLFYSSTQPDLRSIKKRINIKFPGDSPITIIRIES